MVFNATFTNISAISWRSVLLVEEARVPGENNLTWRKSLTNFITYNNPNVTLTLKLNGTYMYKNKLPAYGFK